jgi:capsid protein
LLKRLIAANGKPLPAEKIDKYADVQWQPRRWEWIDPRADVDAAVKSKESLLTSPGQIIRESGRDPLTVWKEFASDIELMKAAGIPDEYIKASILPEQFKVNVNAEANEIDETAKTAAAGTGA